MKISRKFCNNIWGIFEQIFRKLIVIIVNVWCKLKIVAKITRWGKTDRKVIFVFSCPIIFGEKSSICYNFRALVIRFYFWNLASSWKVFIKFLRFMQDSYDMVPKVFRLYVRRTWALLIRYFFFLFLRNFISSEDCKSVHMLKTRQFFYQPEPNYWMIMVCLPY